MSDELVGFTAVFMSLAIPIVAIVMVVGLQVKKKQHDKEIRQLLIENNVDVERAKLLLMEQEKQGDRFANLRVALMLLGLGLGTLTDYLLSVGTGSIYFWLIIAVGLGLGLLISFFVEMKLADRMKRPEAE